jgi:MFS transporter, putative metabolite:H+ symporter
MVEGEEAMSSAVNAGGRLDRLPISGFYYRVFWLIAAGMFFDGYDLYVGGNVLGATLKGGFSTLAQNAQFISFTFIGMTVGSVVAGFLGDHFGRRFSYQFNLMIFGLASLAAAFAPTMDVLNGLRFLMGLGLGAEIVVGYSTMTEFVPPASRGRWLSFMAFVVVAGLPVTSVLGTLIIPTFGWRPMFFIAGVGALIVWYLRKRLPESPRWLESHGQPEAAEALLRQIEAEVAAGGVLPPAKPQAPAVQWALSSLFTRALFPRMVVGSVVLITINTLIFGFVTWLPTFFVMQGLSIAKSFAFTLVIALGSPLGCAMGAFGADYFGRRRLIIGASVASIVFGGIYPFLAAPVAVLGVGFLLIVCIYILTAVLYGVYTPELFPTEVRLRANGLCNMLGRGATIFTPFIVVSLFRAYGVGGVLGLMIGLLVVQIVVVALWGIEPAKRGLETLTPEADEAAARLGSEA